LILFLNEVKAVKRGVQMIILTRALSIKRPPVKARFTLFKTKFSVILKPYFAL
jgi:hypothetical protein